MANKCGNNGNSDRLVSWAPKSLWTVTAATKLNRCLFLERKSLTNLDNIFKKQRHHFTKKMSIYIVKPLVFPVVMYRCESWTLKKADHPRIDAFKLWCWRLLRVPWAAKRSNQSILKEISSVFIGRTDAEVLILWPPDVQSQLIRKVPDAGKDWGQEK